MERTIKISFNFTKNSGDGEVTKEHEKQLEEAALSHIGTMMKNGYYCGELCETVMDSEDPILGDETEYRGWWSSETVTED